MKVKLGQEQSTSKIKTVRQLTLPLRVDWGSGCSDSFDLAPLVPLEVPALDVVGSADAPPWEGDSDCKGKKETKLLHVLYH